MRACFSRKLLASSLVFILSLTFVIVSSVDQDYERLRDIGAPNGLEGGFGSPAENSGLTLEEEPPEDTENEITGGGGGDQFEWKHHHQDHGIYSGRSLMSAENIKPLQDRSEKEEDVEEVELAGARKSSSRLTDDEEDELRPLKTSDFAEKEWQLMFRSFDSSYDSIASSIIMEIGKQTNIFQDIVSRLNPSCQRDINYIRDSVKKHKLWALRMLDSNGKLPSGITYGRFSSPGDYEECLSVRVDDQLYTDVKNNIAEKHKFHGKYCLIDFRLPMPERPKNKLLSIHDSVLNFTGTELGRQFPELVRNYSSYASVFYESGYLHAFCLPSTCDVFDVTKAASKALEGLYVIVNNTIDCEERPEEPVPLRKSQWIAITFLTIVFVNAFIASAAYGLLPKSVRQPAAKDPRHTEAAMKKALESAEDQAKAANSNGPGDKVNRLDLFREAKQARERSGLLQSMKDLSLRNKFYSSCFSIQTNFERLTKPDPRGLTFVHYTRIVAMALTVITHTGALGTLQAITKPADASNSEQIFRDLLPQVLANAFTSIQIFFFMAGFMLVISTFPAIKRDKGHISFMEYAIKRAIRLMPGLAATICLNFIWPLVSDGPMLKFFDRAIAEPCEQNWWHTMAFVSNFDHVEKMCLRHSYFSASDYQLHIIAFPLLVLLYKQPSLALFLAALFTISGFVAQVIMILTKTVLPFMMVDYIDKEAFFNVIHYIHHPVWNHMSSFFYGFIVGYLVVKQIRVKLSETTIRRIWLVLMPAGVVSMFAPYFWNHYKRPIHKWQMILYVIFDRLTLLTTCAWLSYATMVLARKPPAKKPQEAICAPSAKTDSLKSPIEQVLTKGQPPNLATFDNQRSPLASTQDIPSLSRQSTRLGLEVAGSFTSLPRQRSSPNLAYLQQQIQQHQHQQQMLHHLDVGKSGQGLTAGRLSRTVSSSNLAPIAETNTQSLDKTTAATNKPDETRMAAAEQTQQAKPRSQAPVSNINILCLVLSRLTFQLYLFNMVVLCVDVNHSKYYWFFSYYFIIFKAAAVYICSALMAMVFFVVLESPSLTLYIAWVRSRAAARARSTRGPSKSTGEVKIVVPPPLTIAINDEKDTRVTSGSISCPTESVELQSPSTAKPNFSFIDLSSSSNKGPDTVSLNGQKTSHSVDQTKM